MNKNKKKDKVDLDALIPEGVTRIKIHHKSDLKAYIWLAPALILLLTFNFIPPIMSLITSFTSSNGVTMERFVWFANYGEALADGVFWQSILNVFIITIATFILTHVANLFLAELLYSMKAKRLSAFYRVMLIIPMVVPIIVTLMITQYITYSASENSLANIVIGWFGAKPSMWFWDSNPAMVIFTIIIRGFPWAGGTTMLIYLAALQGISTEMIEATKLDGVGSFKRIVHFHLPMMVGQIKYFVITGIIGGMQDYNVQLLITQPASDNGSSMVPGYLIYRQAFTNSRYGLANAIGILLFILILGLTFINNRFIQNKNSEEVK